MIEHNAFSGLDVVYHDAGEREIRAINLYVSATKLYTDAAAENAVSHDLALELCEKGFARIVDTGTIYMVESFKDSAGTLTIGYNSKTITVTAPSL